MKLLGWMHQKFRQNSNETTKDFSIGITGQPSLEELQYYPRGSNFSSTKPFSKAQRDNYYRNSFNSIDIAKMEDYHEQAEEQSHALTELFHGFLAIGTLGTEPNKTTEPATPTFSITVDHIAEKETQVTEDELKLINDELEKVLGAEAEADDSCYVSSGRNSHVSGGRISNCSSVTLNGKPMEASKGNGNANGPIVCPLQSYLLGSAIELTDTSATGKREHRTSLGELFQKAKLTEENCGSKSDKDETKETDKSALHLMKKMLKKRLLHAAAEKKLHKIRHIFNRKVHPESSLLSEQSHQPTKNEIKNDNTQWMASNGDFLPASAEDIIIYPQGTVPKEKTWSFNYQSPSSQFEYNRDDINVNEVWVKTDADYLVLEL